MDGGWVPTLEKEAAADGRGEEPLAEAGATFAAPGGRRLPIGGGLATRPTKNRRGAGRRRVPAGIRGRRRPGAWGSGCRGPDGGFSGCQGSPRTGLNGLAIALPAYRLPCDRPNAFSAKVAIQHVVSILRFAAAADFPVESQFEFLSAARRRAARLSGNVRQPNQVVGD